MSGAKPACNALRGEMQTHTAISESSSNGASPSSQEYLRQGVSLEPEVRGPSLLSKTK